MMAKKEYNFDFTGLIVKGNITQQYKSMLNELVHDTTEVDKLLQYEDDTTAQVEQILYMISKYSFFLHQLEIREEYEKCADLHKMALVLLKMYNYEDDYMRELIDTSINTYKELDNENNNK